MDTILIKNTIIDSIKQIAQEQGINIESINGSDAIVDDLGFASLDIATLVAVLESKLKVDPLSSGKVAITEVRTIDDICEAYSRCLL